MYRKARNWGVGAAAIVLAGLGALHCEGETTTGSGGNASAGSPTGTMTGTPAGTAAGTGTGQGGTTATGTPGGAGEGGIGGTSSNCGGAGCDLGMACCGTECVNLSNDIHNCGHCDNSCEGGGQPFCDGENCAAPPCGGQLCAANRFCCGANCCKLDEICCVVPGPVATGPQCVDPTDSNGTCPMGCYNCVCASPDTPIATPDGERPIAELKVGDPVYSVDHDALRVVPIARVGRTAVHDHQVVRVTLPGGRVLEVSAGHPTADGRTFGDLTPGTLLDGQPVQAVALIPYRHAYTYDILPASDTGTYLAGGVLIGSTLAPSALRAAVTASICR